MPDGSTTCSVCGRVVLATHVNSSGRCVLCAGVSEEKALEAAAAPVPAPDVAIQPNEPEKEPKRP